MVVSNVKSADTANPSRVFATSFASRSRASSAAFGGQIDQPGRRIDQQVERDRHPLALGVHRQLWPTGDGERPQRRDRVPGDAASFQVVEVRDEVQPERLELRRSRQPLLAGRAGERAIVAEEALGHRR